MLASIGLCSAAGPGYYRFPTIHDETVVFTAEGDLWTVGSAGGVAHRLTSHPGTEDHAQISPDGAWVAFSAQYEGPTEAYVMPLAGGRPERLTWDGETASVVGWTPYGEVLISTKAYSTLPSDQLITVQPKTKTVNRIRLAQATDAAWSSGASYDTTLYFTRLPWQGSSTRNYTGGTAQQIWALKPGAAEAINLCGDWKGTSKNPLWHEGRVYFLSDREGQTMNLWSMKADGSDVKPHTAHRDFEAKSASIHNGRIIYQHGADLRLFDIAAQSDQLIPIQLQSDFDQTREKWVQKPLDYLTSAHLSPKGDRVVLTARGQLFVAPFDAEKQGGRFVSVPEKAGVRMRFGQFMPDGKSLLALSDESGELEFVTRPSDGLGAGESLTNDGVVYRFQPVISPNGAWLAWQDKNQDLWVRDLGAKRSVKVATSTEDEFSGLTWSPDSQWLAYVEQAPNTYRQLKLYRPSDATLKTITSDRTNASTPAWSPDGQWLYFLSDRSLRTLVKSPWGDRQPEPFFTEVTKVYAYALKSGLKPAWQPPAEGEKGKEKGGDEKSGEKTDKKLVIVDIEFDGLEARLWEVPIEAGNWDDLAVTDSSLFFTEKPLGFGTNALLKRWSIKPAAQPQIVSRDVKSWELSLDRKTLLLRTEKDGFHVMEANGDVPAKLEKGLDLTGWELSVIPQDEWRVIYNEAWRMLRDYFYDRDTHGLDWKAIRAKYEPRVVRVADRGDLSDLLQEMAGELQALHIYVRFGDHREGPDQVKFGYLGGKFDRDEPNGGWKVSHIFQSDPDYPDQLSPLIRPNVGVREGDVILSVNGRSTLNVPHLQTLLRHQAGNDVLLEVKSGNDSPRRVSVKALGLEAAQDLRYDEWEYTRRLEVERLGNAKIGYVHLRAMGEENIAEWARDFYPVFNREGLIIDVRHNRGGNIDSWVLGRLLRKAWMYWSDRVGNPTWNMQYAFRGHVVVLCNERTASDGEAFSEGFRRLGLGKVIGTRTWGGEIWLSSQKWLVDSGMCTAAESGVYGPEGAWLIEQHGVDPDIIVDNPPKQTYEGQDAQLKAAIDHLKDLIAKEPRPVPAVPAKPKKR